MEILISTGLQQWRDEEGTPLEPPPGASSLAAGDSLCWRLLSATAVYSLQLKEPRATVVAVVATMLVQPVTEVASPENGP